METTIIEILRFLENKLSKNFNVYNVLDKFGLKELKPDFNSIYYRTLIEYGVKKFPPQFCQLFAEKEIISTFKDELYEKNQEIFWNIINNTFEVIYEKELKDLEIHPDDRDLNKEIKNFKDKFKEITHTTRNPKELEMYNKITNLEINSMKQTFNYQSEKYLKHLIREFKRDFPNNKYIYQKGKTKILIKEKKKKKQITNEIQIKEKFNIKSLNPVDDFITNWINDDSQKFLVIMGEYGTGKTSLCKHIANELSESYFGTETKIIKDKYRRKVFLFNLRNFNGGDVEKYIIAELNENGIEDFNKPDLYNRIENNELLIIFDAFDEMTQKIDTDEKIANFFQIEKLIRDRKNSKVILSSREEYFASEEELNEVFKKKENKNYQIIHLSLFDDEQIRKYLETHTTDAQYYIDKIEGIYDLSDLAPRPVLLDFIVKYLPDLINKKGDNFKINASDLYDYIINDELSRKKIELPTLENKLPSRTRLQLLQQLSIWMHNINTLTIDTRLIMETLNLKKFFKVKVDYEIIKYLNIFLNFTFLIKESDYLYRISHKSFRDFLVAKELVKEIEDKHINVFNKIQINYEVMHFLSEQKPNVSNLETVLSGKIDNTENPKWEKSNAINVLLKISNLLYNKCIDFREKSVDISKSNIHNLSPLKFYGNFISLDLSENQLSDIEPLKEINETRILSLKHNQIKDISPLKAMNKLEYLNLSFNQLTDVTLLKSFKNIKYLYLVGNQINNYNPVKELGNLSELYLSDLQFNVTQKNEMKNSLKNTNIFYVKDKTYAIKEIKNKF